MDFDKLTNKIKAAKDSYYRLLLVLSPFAESNTKLLKEEKKNVNNALLDKMRSYISSGSW